MSETFSFSALLLLGLAAPLVGAALCPLAYRFLGRAAIAVPAAAAGASFSSILLLVRDLAFRPRLAAWRWVDELPLSFSFRLDGFGGLFALLVAGMGVLIVWYAHFYMKGETGQGRFFSFLLLFFGAMLGVALSDHFFTTFLFWEATSVSSFLLIGFWHERERSREGALKALFITSIGGLFMFAGLALLGTKTGVWTWSALPGIAPAAAGEAWVPWAFALILLGVFTKSAQFPFHIWLPDAMEAPTPVSAYLHSATMVKAGVFLLFRLHPFFGQTPLWVPSLVLVGMTTAVVGAVLALKHRDLKAMLAYSTISQLGLFVALHGYSGLHTELARALRAAFIFHIFVHAFYKGSLFMLVGVVDHAAHTRDIGKLGHLWKSMPRVTFFFLLSAASMAGLPPLLGFISKEAVLETFLGSRASWGWAPLAALAASAAITVAVALKLSVGLGFLPPEQPAHLNRHPPQDAGWGLLLPPALLSLAGLAFGLAPGLLAGWLYPAALIGLPPALTPKFALWHGVNAALLISAGAVTAGLVFFWFRAPIQAFQDSIKPRWNWNTFYNAFWDLSLAGARRLTGAIQNGSLTRYCAVLITFLVLVGAGAVFTRPLPAFRPTAWAELATLESLAVFVLIVAAFLVVWLKDLLARIITLGVVGILMCAFFTLRGAPDLALTGFLVEIVLFIVVLLVFNTLKPEEDVPPTRPGVAARAVLAGLGGLVVGGFMLAVLDNPLGPSIHPYFNEFSASLAGGLNVVNVILVDFRGADTMGEILVLCLAAIGVFTLRRVWVHRPDRPEAPPELKMRALPASFLLAAVSRICFPVIVAYSLYLTLKGHNNPGGGFIGGLVCACGLVLEMLAFGRKRALKMIPVNGRLLYGLGLAVAFITGLAPLLGGLPFLTSAVFHQWHFSTAGIFDIGVYLVVVGVTLEMATLVGEAERVPE